MSIVFQVNMFNAIKAMSAASELTNLKIANHSERVAYIALKIADQLSLDEHSRYILTKSCLLHDLGVSSSREKLSVVDLSTEKSLVAPHCIQGADLLNETKLFSNLASIILRHHDPWIGKSIVNEPGQPNLLSQILHLADRIEILIDKKKYILWQKSTLVDHVLSLNNSEFNPVIVDAFRQVAEKDNFWLDLQYGYFTYYLSEMIAASQRNLTLDELEDIAKLFSKIIDRKSSFTANHSQGVARYATNIGKLVGFSPLKQKQLKIAGLLHDLGKLSIPDELLNYAGKYSAEQRLLMNQHVYHTYHLVNSIGPGLYQIRDWAAFHHERLDGTGYPFGKNSDQLDMGSRIVAVADITQALTEERPYRSRLPVTKIRSILLGLAKDNAIDSDLVQLVIKNCLNI